jgi:outer membrane usher protein
MRGALFLAACTVAAPSWAQDGPAVSSTGVADPIAANQAPTSDQPARRPSRSATLPLALVIDGARLGNVTGTITEVELLEVHAGELLRVLEPLVNDQAATRLRALGDALAPVERLAGTGVTVALDPATFALLVEIDRGSRRAQSFTASGEYRISGAEPVAPADFSAGLTGALVADTPISGDVDLNASLALAGFINIGGVRGVNVDFGADVSSLGRSEVRYQRNRIVAFKDFPEQAIRVSAGDVVPDSPRLAGTSDIFGLTIARDYAALQPTRNIRPTLSRSVTLDRRSIVEVYVNQALAERFQAGPGPIDIDRIPLTATSNDVVIVVEDALGRREIENLTFGSDLTLLEAGLGVYSLSVGVLRDPGSFGFRYTDDPVVSGYYQRGLSPALTAGAHAVATRELQNIGAAAGVATAAGVITAEVAVSNERSFGTGAALGLTYRGTPFFGADSDELASATFDYRTRDFATLGQFGFRDTLKYDFRADYQKAVRPGLALFTNVNIFERYDAEGVGRGVTAGVRYRLGPVTVNGGVRHLRDINQPSSWGAFLSLSVPIGSTAGVTAQYDTADNRGRAEYRRRRGLELPEVDYRLGAQTSDSDQSLFGGFSYADTRFAGAGDVFSTLPPEGDNITTASARLQTGIGYAGGRAAIGRDPARGFAIVSRHASIRDAELTVKASSVGRVLAVADELGPALVPIGSPYRPQVVTVDANNIPPGYDIGAGRYVLEPGARSGMHIQIGSDLFRSALATLIYADEPVALASGRYRSIDNSAAQGAFFTNRAGRAIFEKLAPGRYVLTIEQLNLTGEFVVPYTNDALIRLGELALRQR